MNTIVVALSSVFDIYLLHFFFSNYFSKKEKVWGNVFLKKGAQIGLVLLMVLCNIVGNGDWNIMFVPAILLLYAILVFDGKIRNKLVYLLTVFCVLYGCEFLFMILIQPSESEYKNSTYMILCIILIKFLSYVCILFLNQIIGKKRKVQYTNIFMMYLTIPMSSLLIMCIIFYSKVFLYISDTVCVLLVVGFVFLFLGNFLSFYAFQRYSERLYETMRQNILIVKQQKNLDYYMKLAEISDKQKEMIHNITNHMRMIRCFAKAGDINSIFKITDSISNEIEKDVSPIMCSNSVLNSILNEKSEEAKQQGISVEIYVEPGALLEHIQIVDLISVLGNLFDNAIRAAAESEGDKYIKAYIYMNDVGGFCVVKILNTFRAVKRLENGEFVSTKKNEGVHGIGLQSVNRIAEKYGGYLTCTVQEKIFESVLLISADEE